MANIPTNASERMAVQIDEIYNRLSTIESLIADLAPGIEKVSMETRTAVAEIRERFERDESLTLIKKVGENIPTFIKLLDVLAATKGLVEDMYPSLEKISKETTPSIRMLRESFEKDEALELIQKAGENIGVFNKLLNFLASFETKEIDILLGSQMQQMIKGMGKCATKTMQQFTKESPKPGLGKLIFAIGDPEIQKGLLFLTTFARNMPESISGTIKEG